MSRREFLASTLERTGLGAVLSRTVGRWKGLVVFNYHRVGDGHATLLDKGIYSATQEEFDKQVRFLKKHFDVIGASDLDNLMHQRGRAVMLTFDDGYRDNYEFAFPVLARHQVPATFFVTSGFLDSAPLAWWDEIAWMVHSSSKKWLFPSPALPELLSLATPEDREFAIHTLLQVYKTLTAELTEPFLQDIAHRTGAGRGPQDLARNLWMNWDMVKEMDLSGMDIGGHTVTHPVLSQSTPEVQRDEIFRSKARIESVLGHPISVFSYPVGQPDSYTEGTQELLHEAGYRWAFSFSGGFAMPGKVNQLSVPRVAVAPNISHELFQATARLPWLFA